MKKSPLRRKSKNPRTTARKRAWAEFSKFIRNRDPKCVTCGAPSTQAGHFIHGVTDTWLNFNEKNIHGQCSRCNLYLSGNQIEYTLFMLKKYGGKTVQRLRSERDAYKKLDYARPTIEDYRDLLVKYQKKNKQYGDI